jgi:hypothetical protein
LIFGEDVVVVEVDVVARGGAALAARKDSEEVDDVLLFGEDEVVVEVDGVAEAFDRDGNGEGGFGPAEERSINGRDGERVAAVQCGGGVGDGERGTGRAGDHFAGGQYAIDQCDVVAGPLVGELALADDLRAEGGGVAGKDAGWQRHARERHARREVEQASEVSRVIEEGPARGAKAKQTGFGIGVDARKRE